MFWETAARVRAFFWPVMLTLAIAGSPATVTGAPFESEGPYVKAGALGIEVGTLTPGPLDAITDIPGVRVGHVTHVEGSGPLIPGRGPARTGITAILPRSDIWRHKVFAAVWPLNGNGEMTGSLWVNESGFLEVPILLTDTLSVGRVDDGVVTWMIKRYSKIGITDDVPLPVVAEVDDEFLNDQQGRHNTAADAVRALDAAASGPVTQGAVGAGTGTSSYSFKGGIGTASRVLAPADGGYRVGVLVNTNTGRRSELLVNGVPVGREITDLRPKEGKPSEGSIIVVIATNAPLLHDGLERLSKRAALGIARTGGTARDGSGDLIIAFSTATDVPHYPEAITYAARTVDHSHMTPLFTAVVEATEESVINALLAAHDMTGRDGNTVYALPHDRLLQILHKYGR